MIQVVRYVNQGRVKDAYPLTIVLLMTFGMSLDGSSMEFWGIANRRYDNDL